MRPTLSTSRRRPRDARRRRDATNRRIVGRERHLDEGDLQRIAPMFFMRGNTPAHFKHVRMILILARNQLKFRARIGDAIQSEPADGGFEMMRVWRFKRLHVRILAGAIET
jgi:hypothetical protein